MTVKILRLDDYGRGICYVNDKITFVPNTCIADEVEIEIIKETKKYNIAMVKKIISSNRQESFCPYSSTCGGCSLSLMKYEDTLTFKKQKLEHIFKKFCNLDINIPAIASPNTLEYRNKITLHVKEGRIGLYKEETNEIVSIDECKLVSFKVNEFIKLIPDFKIKNGTVVIRNNYNMEILANFITDDKLELPNLTNFKIVGILQNGHILRGEDFFIERLNNMYFKVSYDAFFQINLGITEHLFSLLLELAPKDKCVLDLFCGTGTLGLTLAPFSKKVYGIEINKNATINATYNAKINGLNNCFYLCGDANELISKINDKIDLVIIDPPRSGMSKNGIELLKKVNANDIIYIACDPITLARDINYLKNDYSIKSVIGLDMFSFTYHVETICYLTKK